MRFGSSGSSKSIESRVKMMGLSLFLMASATATQVALFLDKSPIKSEAPPEATKSQRSGDLSKEPESVAGRKLISGKGGTFDLSDSGSKMFSCLIGKVFVKYSAVWMTLEKLPELPPMILIVPVFCSGMFQLKSWKSFRSGFFCQ